MDAGWFTNDSNRRGTRGHSTAEGLVVQTAMNYVNSSPNITGGSAEGGSLTSAPCKVVVTYHGRATDA